MGIDIGQFVQIFLEEANEHLTTMESGLLGIDLAAPDSESLNAIFRAAHSIKGGAGTFGFGDMADFTHTLETLLDHVRRGELALDEERLDACLRAVDLLRAMLERHQGGRDGEVGDADALAAELAALIAPPAGGRAHARPAPLASAPQAAGAPPRRSLRIAIDIPAGAIPDADAVTGLIHTLGQLGTLELQQQPAAGEASGHWALTIDSDMDAHGLHDFVSYVLAPEWVRIEDAAAGDGGNGSDDGDGFGFFMPLPAGDAAATDDGYGFFDPLPTPRAASDDDGYGFFDAPDLAGGAPAAAAGDTAAGVAAAYGFFDTPAPAAAATGEAYGFFDVPAAPEPAATEAYGFFTAPPAAAAGPAPTATAPTRPRAADKPPQAGGDATSIRVGIDKVDRLINLVGELVITQSMLLQSAHALDPVAHERMLNGLAQLERNSRDLQESVMSIRMVPMSFVFSRYPRMVRDLAKKLGKTVELQLVGESTELDKGLIEKIVDPLTHLVRNAVDHGLEPPEGRRAAGKPATGQITLSAAHQSGHILIEIADDGAGLNRERILAKAARQGLAIGPEATDAEVWDLIFAPGFSTAEEVTDVSGRGVGMDVVRKNIQALGGSVHLWSATGQGTRVSIRLPLTLAILDGMSVRSGDETFIVPLDFVVESLHGTGLEFRSIGRDGRVVRVRADYLPVVSLAELLDIAAASQPVEQAVLVVLEADGRRIALAVDTLLGQHQVVVKNLETNFRRVNGISGATILGDGRVSLILDVSGLIRMANPEGMSAAA